MARDLQVEAVLKAIVDKGSQKTVEALRKEFRKTEKQIDQAKKSVDQAEKSLGGMKSVVSDLKRELAGFVGLGVLTKVAKDGVAAFAQYERQLRGIRVQLREIGQEAQASRIQDFIEALEASAGVLRQDVSREYQIFLGLTKDVEQAMVLTETAVGAANRQNLEFGNAARLLGSILQGEVIEPAKSLGIAFDQTRDSAEQSAEVLDAAINKFREFSGEIDDTQGRLDAFSAEWNEWKLTIGEGAAALTDIFAPALRFVRRLIQSWGTALTFTFGNIIKVVGEVGKTLAFAFNPRNWFDGSVRRELITRVQRSLEDIKFLNQGAADELVDIWTDSGKKQAEGESKAKEALLEAASARARKKAEEEAKRKAEKAAEFERRAEEQLLKQRIQMAEEGSDEKLALELELLGRLEQAALEQARAVGASTLAIEKSFLLARQKLREDYAKEEIESIGEQRDILGEVYQEILEERADMEARFREDLWNAEFDAAQENMDRRHEMELERLEMDYERELEAANAIGADTNALHAAYSQKRTNLERKQAGERVGLAQAEAKARVQMALTVAQAVVQLGMAVFGETKALRYAGAIIDTASAIAEASPNPVAIAAAAALGAAQIATIAKTEPASSGSIGAIGGDVTAGRGFDNPANDRLAYLGGRRWAADMARNVVGGFNAELGGLTVAPAGGGSVTNSSAVNLNIRGPAIIDRRALRRFMRKAERAKRQDKARRMR